MARSVLLSVVAALATASVSVSCDGSEKNQSRPGQTARASADSPAIAHQSVPAKPAILDLRLVVDSGIAEPLLEKHAGGYIVRLPTGTARPLEDSLPGFRPIALSVWGAAFVEWIDSLAGGAAVPSVVVGDFNGDKMRDIVLWGSTQEVSAVVMILTKSTANPSPRVHFISRVKVYTPTSEGYLGLVRPRKLIDPYGESDSVDLRTDAFFWAVVDKTSVVYYLDNGVLKEFVSSD